MRVSVCVRLTLLLLAIFAAPQIAAAEPVVEGFVESSEALEGSTSTLHVTVTNRSKASLGVIDLRFIPEALAGARGPQRNLTLLKGQSATFAFPFNVPRGAGEAAVGVRIEWKSAEDAGVRAVSLGKVRVIKPLVREITDIALRTGIGAVLLALLTLAGNFFLNRAKSEWDERQAERLRKDDVVRRAGEQVHALSQRHYARIVSWAASLDEEASFHAAPTESPSSTPAAPIPNERSEYLCYLLSHYLKLEADLEDDAGGYFLRDLGAEVVQTYLYSDTARLVAKPGYLDDEEYSHFVQQLGSRKTFVEFRHFVRADDMAARAMARVQVLLNDQETLARLVRVARLKWTLLELHLNRMRLRAGWYPSPTGDVLDDNDLSILDEVLSRMVSGGTFTEPEGSEYRKSLTGTNESRP